MLETSSPPPFSARELVLSLIDSTTRPVLSIHRLIAAGSLYDIDPGAMRVAVTRLVREQVLEQRDRGSYGVGPEGQPMHKTVRAWYRVEEELKPWTGEWIAAFAGHLKRTNKKQVRIRDRALKLRGFSAFDPGLWVRPDNLKSSLDETCAHLISLGLDEDVVLMKATDLATQQDAFFRQLWDIEELERLYQSHVDALARSTKIVDTLPLEQAARDCLALGKMITRDILMDPLLPSELIDTELRTRMIGDMFAYDRMAKGLWVKFYEKIEEMT